MALCLMAPNNYMNQYCIVIQVQWHESDGTTPRPLLKSAWQLLALWNNTWVERTYRDGYNEDQDSRSNSAEPQDLSAPTLIAFVHHRMPSWFLNQTMFRKQVLFVIKFLHTKMAWVVESCWWSYNTRSHGVSRQHLVCPRKNMTGSTYTVFEIALGTLLDIRSTNELTFGGPTLILADQRNTSYQK